MGVLTENLRFCEQCGQPITGTGRWTCSQKCNGMRKRRLSEFRVRGDAFDVYTPNMAYALGLFYTDGCLSRLKTGGSWNIGFSNTDYETVVWWHNFVGSQTVISTTRRNSRKVAYQSQCRSDVLGGRLLALGILPRKSWQDLHIPVMPPECLSSFLRGVFDGDGSIFFTKPRKGSTKQGLGVNITSNSPTFRIALQEAFASLGWHASNSGLMVMLSGSPAEMFCSWIYASEGPCMTRKRTVWEAWRAYRATLGGLIHETDSHRFLRGLRHQTWHDLVGTMPDAELARQICTSPDNVTRVRKIKGVSLFQSPHTRGPRLWHDLVGTMPDTVLGRQYGVAASRVCTYRNRVGVPAFHP